MSPLNLPVVTSLQRANLRLVKGGFVIRLGASDTARHVLGGTDQSAGSYMTWLKLLNMELIDYQRIDSKHWLAVLTDKGEAVLQQKVME